MDGSATKGNWDAPDLSVATVNRRSPPRMPVEIFGPVLAPWLSVAAEGAGSPVDFVAGPLLACAAALIGNNRKASPWDSWNEPSALWTCVVGDPSTNKSPGADPVITAIRSLETELASGYETTVREWRTGCEASKCALEIWQKDVQQAAKLGTPPPLMPAAATAPQKPTRPRLMVNDLTPEKAGELIMANPRGLLFHRDEMAGWFNGFGRYSGQEGVERAFWLECYGGRPYSIDRVKSPEPILIERLLIGVSGGTQPDRLADIQRGPDDGLLARILWFFPDRVPPSRPSQCADPNVLAGVLRRLLEVQPALGQDDKPCPQICRLTPQAVDAFQAFREDLFRDELTGPLGSAIGKAPGHVLRLALILTFLWWAAAPTTSLLPDWIGLDAIEAAIQLVRDYFLPMAERVFGDAALPEADRLATVLAQWIQKRKPAGLNARDLRRSAKLPGLNAPDKVDLACKELCNAGWLRPARHRAGDTPGRQRKDFEVNPRLWDRQQPRALQSS